MNTVGSYQELSQSFIYHVIEAGHQMLKLPLNVEIFVYFLVFFGVEKKAKLMCKVSNEIKHLKVPQNEFHRNR